MVGRLRFVWWFRTSPRIFPFSSYSPSWIQGLVGLTSMQRFLGIKLPRRNNVLFFDRGRLGVGWWSGWYSDKDGEKKNDSIEGESLDHWGLIGERRGEDTLKGYIKKAVDKVAFIRDAVTCSGGAMCLIEGLSGPSRWKLYACCSSALQPGDIWRKLVVSFKSRRQRNGSMGHRNQLMKMNQLM